MKPYTQFGEHTSKNHRAYSLACSASHIPLHFIPKIPAISLTDKGKYQMNLIKTI